MYLLDTNTCITLIRRSTDTLLAAQARSLGAIMVTNNTTEFERVPRLVVEDWTRRRYR